MSINEENGLKLKGFRKQNGFSQSYIGEIVGKDFRTISRYELGYAMPKSVIDILNQKYNLRLKVQKVKTTPKMTTRTTKEETIVKSLEAVIDTLNKIVEQLHETSI
jgi:transcriptional regulator with XRE-family HTH domain